MKTKKIKPVKAWAIVLNGTIRYMYGVTTNKVDLNDLQITLLPTRDYQAMRKELRELRSEENRKKLTAKYTGGLAPI